MDRRRKPEGRRIVIQAHHSKAQRCFTDSAGNAPNRFFGSKEKFKFFLIISPFVVPHEGLFSDNRGTFPYIYEILVKIREILVKIREIFEQISEILRKIYGVFKAIFGIACKIERVLKEMRGVSMPISRIACKTRRSAR